MSFGPVHRLMLRDALLALVVLGLSFLNFGHDSAVFASGGRLVVTGTSICGDQSGSHDGDHFACHACRPGTAVLPAPPAGAEPVVFATSPVTYAAAPCTTQAVAFTSSVQPRGPPAV
jgi:hypothetical protein